MAKPDAIPARFVSLAGQWHDGSSSMLYAVASTGKLERGNARPWAPHQYRFATDSEWSLSLWVRLKHELENTLSAAQHSSQPDIKADSESLGEFLSLAIKRAASWQRKVKREGKSIPEPQA